MQYYKPWQLRSGDEAVIREQIEEAEATVAREVAEFDARYPPEAFVYQKIEPISTEPAGPTGELEGLQQQEAKPVPEQDTATKSEAETKELEVTSDKKDAEPSIEQPTESLQNVDTVSASVVEAADAKDAHRSPHDDDGDEMLEDNEDTVIY